MNVCAKGCYRQLLSAGIRVSLLNRATSPGDTAFCLQKVVPLEGVEVFKFNSSVFVFFLLSGCSSDLVLSSPEQPEYKSMPEITQSVTPSQQRAIMSGERPDWSERAPVNTMKRY